MKKFRLPVGLYSLQAKYSTKYIGELAPSLNVFVQTVSHVITLSLYGTVRETSNSAPSSRESALKSKPFQRALSVS
ncbi:hypothetical protein NXU94_24445 [Bacteroides faecis]|uniref:hypothetical protein n=1 Tax=Bacteroides faecis TaxID=674529 RepID=UPI002165AAA7|nr:hypothetical protein [Bacteroides faecis]MCS3070120.1 hypothetical protein [Bacteroides faecis]